MPLLRGTALDSWRNRILIENSYDKRGPYGAVRTDRYKLIQGGGKKDMLFDLDADPHENTNTIDTADPALVQQLRASIEALKECSQQSCRDIEDTQ
jgi:arylsulfatase A-like enzyme